MPVNLALNKDTWANTDDNSSQTLVDGNYETALTFNSTSGTFIVDLDRLVFVHRIRLYKNNTGGNIKKGTSIEHIIGTVAAFH